MKKAQWRVLLTGFVLVAPVLINAQSNGSNNKPGFQTSIGTSFLAGDRGPGWNLQMVNGVNINDWFVGLGAGLDSYEFRTVPVFLSARRDRILNRSLFAFADAGVCIPAVTENQKRSFMLEDEFYTGFYSELGVGLSVATGRKSSIRFSAGYTIRTLKEKSVFPSASSFWLPGSEDDSIYKYTFRLVTLRAAFSLGAQ